mgnify:FL=1
MASILSRKESPFEEVYQGKELLDLEMRNVDREEEIEYLFHGERAGVVSRKVGVEASEGGREAAEEEELADELFRIPHELLFLLLCRGRSCHGSALLRMWWVLLASQSAISTVATEPGEEEAEQV